MLNELFGSYSVQMGKLLGFSIIVTLVTIMLWLVFAVVKMFRESLIEYRSKKINKQRRVLLDQAKSILSRQNIPQFICNYHKGVFAIVTKANFDVALHNYYDDLAVIGKISCNQVIMWVQDTYTFASSADTVRPIHTGDRRCMEKSLILGVMMRYPCFAQLSQLAPLQEREIEELIVCFVKKDSRLFVPYCGSVHDAEKQLNFFGKKTDVDFDSLIISMVS